MTRTVAAQRRAGGGRAADRAKSGVPSGYSVPGMISPSLKPGRFCG